MEDLCLLRDSSGPCSEQHGITLKLLGLSQDERKSRDFTITRNGLAPNGNNDGQNVGQQKGKRKSAGRVPMLSWIENTP
jgi:hypothetical protein